jgi:hypothetical protein
VQDHLVLSWSIRAHQLGEPELSPAPKLTDSYRTTSMLFPEAAHAGGGGVDDKDARGVHAFVQLLDAPARLPSILETSLLLSQ